MGGCINKLTKSSSGSGAPSDSKRKQQYENNNNQLSENGRQEVQYEQSENPTHNQPKFTTNEDNFMGKDRHRLDWDSFGIT